MRRATAQTTLEKARERIVMGSKQERIDKIEGFIKAGVTPFHLHAGVPDAREKRDARLRGRDNPRFSRLGLGTSPDKAQAISITACYPIAAVGCASLRAESFRLESIKIDSESRALNKLTNGHSWSSCGKRRIAELRLAVDLRSLIVTSTETLTRSCCL